MTSWLNFWVTLNSNSADYQRRCNTSSTVTLLWRLTSQTWSVWSFNMRDGRFNHRILLCFYVPIGSHQSNLAQIRCRPIGVTWRSQWSAAIPSVTLCKLSPLGSSRAGQELLHIAFQLGERRLRQ